MTKKTLATAALSRSKQRATPSSRGDLHAGGHDARLPLEKQADGDHFARFTTANGDVLFESTLHDGIDTMRLFGGTLTITGSGDATDPITEGDKNELVRFSQLPEAKLVRPLGDALHDAGVARDCSSTNWGALRQITDFWSYNESLAPGASRIVFGPIGTTSSSSGTSAPGAMLPYGHWAKLT